MKRSTRGLLALAVLLAGTGCAATTGAAGGAGGPRGDVNRITLEEMQQRGQFADLYSLIQELRPRWLRSQGPDTFMGPQGQVQVHMDGNRLGGVDALRSLAASGVTSIEWVPPIQASGRFGLDHSHGAIVISTRPVH